MAIDSVHQFVVKGDLLRCWDAEGDFDDGNQNVLVNSRSNEGSHGIYTVKRIVKGKHNFKYELEEHPGLLFDDIRFDA